MEPNEYFKRNNDRRNIVDIQSDYLKAKTDLLEETISFNFSEEMFTLFSFLNYTGYNEEISYDYSMVRKKVREELSNLNPQISNKNYYIEKNLLPIKYIYELNFIGNAPDFKPIVERQGQLGDLSEKLREFYHAANIHELYIKYEQYYEKEVNLFRTYSYLSNKMARYNTFLNLNENEKLVIEYNLLDSHRTGYTLKDDKSPKKYKIILGPEHIFGNGVIGAETLMHEYLHYQINAILDKLEPEINQYSNKMKIIPSNVLATGDYYNNWYSIVNESLIRGLDSRIDEKAIQYDGGKPVDYNMNQGFIMTKYFYDRFGEWPEYEGSLESFIKKIINEYKNY